MKGILTILNNKNIIEVKKMKIEKLLALLYNYSKSLNEEILIYDSDNNELELFDIERYKGKIVMIFDQKPSITEVEK